MKCPICGLEVEDLEIHRKVAHGEWKGAYPFEKPKTKVTYALLNGKEVKIVIKQGIGYVEGYK